MEYFKSKIKQFKDNYLTPKEEKNYNSILNSYETNNSSFSSVGSTSNSKNDNKDNEDEMDIIKHYSHLYDVPLFRKILDKSKKIIEINTLIKIYKILDEINQGGFNSLDESKLQILMFSGIPDEVPVLRTLLWKLALKYPNIQIIHTPKWQNEIDTKRKEYFDKVDKHYFYLNKYASLKQENKDSDHPLNEQNSSDWNHYFKDLELLDEIKKDVRRTRAQMSFFFMPADKTIHVTNEEIVLKADYTIEHTKKSKSLIENDFQTHGDVLTRILYIYSKEYPNIRYVQGMNEILAILYYQFCLDNDCDNNLFQEMENNIKVDNIKNSDQKNSEEELNSQSHEENDKNKSQRVYKENEKIEADSYFCFNNLMDEIKDLFIREKDMTRSGIQTRIKGINLLLREIDKEIYNHFIDESVEIQFFMFRWYTLLFTQEYEMPDVLRLWDSILSFIKLNSNRYTDKFMFLNYLSLAAILKKKVDILNSDFSGIMMCFQSMDFTDVHDHIRNADIIRQFYREKYNIK